MKLKDNSLGLIDGEHARVDGVENYDICYFIQRVFSIVKNLDIANSIVEELLKRGYEKEKLKPVLAARAIGGFLDESLAPNPDYSYAAKFTTFVNQV